MAVRKEKMRSGIYGPLEGDFRHAPLLWVENQWVVNGAWVVRPTSKTSGVCRETPGDEFHFLMPVPRKRGENEADYNAVIERAREMLVRRQRGE